jgi:hypothetical protein
MELGAFSVSLAVRDLEASRSFYGAHDQPALSGVSEERREAELLLTFDV